MRVCKSEGRKNGSRDSRISSRRNSSRELEWKDGEK